MLSHIRRKCGATMLAALSACSEKASEPLVPGATVAIFASGVTAVVGAAVASPPALKVTTSKGTAVSGIAVTFAVQGGGGSVTGAIQTTNSEGIATVGSWTLGTTAGANTLTATTSSLPVVTFTATGVAGPAAKLAFSTAPSATATNRVAFAAQPVVQIQDANSNPVTTSTASVTAVISSGSGTINGTTTVAAVNGVATFTNLSIAGSAGAKTLSFSALGLTVATAQVTTSAGVAASVAVNAGNDQSAAGGTAVPTPPSVKVSDADGNSVSGTVVSYAVASGGGSISAANPVSDANGIAAVGSWTLGPSLGANTLTATATGLTGSPVTFTATGSNTSVTAVSPATLTSGISATITGQGFSATAASNTVTIDGVAASVSAASPTQLTVTVPTLPCTPGHDAPVSVSVGGGGAATRNHPIQAATQRALTVGQSLVISTAAEARCNELSNTGGLYYVNVYNTSTTYSTTGASFELNGATGAASLMANPNMVTPPALAPRQPPRVATAEDEADRAHLNLLERDLQFLRQNGRNWRNGITARSLAPGGTTALAVGDPMSLRLRDLNTSSCQNFLSITGRVAYVGTRSIIVEDNANELAGTIDTTYAQIGSEFDIVMWPILETNYGNPIVNDAALDNNQKVVMVFTNKVRTFSGGNLAGFVSGCDFFPQSTYASSNMGEFFYATAPQVAGVISDNNQNPPRWRWSMRGTIIHEVKHIVSTGERFSRNGGSAFEESWLEETTARISEELYERARYNLGQRANIGYGSAGNQAGPYCGVRACNGQARGIIRVFEELAAKWYAASHDYSPLGRINASDFSFYATGWSLVRWAIDASANTEATILKGMTQEPTKTGISNFDQYTGTTFGAALPKWTMAMVLDDYPGFAPTDATLTQPSWNLRNVFAGYDTDFAVSWTNWPLLPLLNTFGAFARTASVRAGTSAIIQLSGTQSAKQLLELKASGSTAAAPAELRLAIVRVQ